MSDQGGSDLDVFDGLAKKPSSPEPARHQKTILGLAAPPAPPSKAGAPPPPPTLSKMPPPPPPPATSRAAAPPPPAPPAPSAPMPTPPIAAAPPAPPVAPAPIPAAPLPPAPIAAAPPAPVAPPAAPIASAPVAVAPPARSPSKVPPPPPSPSLPQTIVGAPAVPVIAPPAAPTPTSVPLATGKDSDWDDEDEKTTVFDRAGDDSAAKALLHGAPTPAAGARPAGLPAAAVPAPAVPAPAAAPIPSAPKLSAPLPPPPTPSAVPKIPSVPPPPGVVPSAPAAVPPPQVVAQPSAPAPYVSQPVQGAPLQSAPMQSAPMTSQPMHSAPMMSQPYAAPPAQGSSKLGMILGGVAAVGLIGVAAVFLMAPKTGALVITVAAPNGKSASGVTVKVDDAVVCQSSPCIAKDLPKGTHMVSAAAPGYADAATQAFKVIAGEETPVNIQLAPKSAGTGVKVSSKVSGLKLLVDGKEVGPLPQSLTTLTPGSHEVEVTGNPYFGSFKKTVDVPADELVSVDADVPFVKGEITIELGDNTDKAKIWLKGNGDDKALHSIKPFPKLISIPADRSVRLVAEKPGFEKYEEVVSLSAEQPTKTYRISLYKKGQAPSAGAAPAPAPAGGTSTPAPAPQTHSPAPAPAATPSGAAKLNINSIPISNVMLDGKPLGSTPKIGVNVSPGAHTVVFVHPELGRKVSQVTVAAGQTATAAVRFK